MVQIKRCSHQRILFHTHTHMHFPGRGCDVCVIWSNSGA